MTGSAPEDAPLGQRVEVAVPVPLRRTFTYGLPDALQDAVRVGSRVAVPFGPRKLAGFVLGPAEPPPEGTRVRNVAGILDPQPLFHAELLGFLARAAEYYLHPIGEVLRAAAPALPSEAMAALRKGGFLDPGEALPGTRIATRRVLVASPAPHEGELPRLGKNQSLLLSLLRERGSVTLDELRRHAKNPRGVLRALEGKGLVNTEEREVPADRFFADEAPVVPAPDPNAGQVLAIGKLVAALDGGGGFLLHGITGSGKTEVYLRVIAEARARGRGALMLVPEIALTPQLVARFRGRFGDAIAVLHSELSARERDDAWRSLRAGRVQLAIGARSALFAPVQDLAVVVVDEEHDGSFKQEDGFRYHARDMAMLRAHRAGAVCILGSATPSLESYRLAQQRRLELLTLDQRATSQTLPPVEVVDLSRHRGTPSGQRLLTAPLHQALGSCLEAGEQAILFLNRRGFSPSARCGQCGELLECPACSVALTVHRAARVLRCHYCDFSTPNTGACILCGSPDLIELGVGTEQLEAALRQVFPDARVARLDRDTASGEGVEAVLDRLRRHEVDVLVGTQMVTKGHDLPGVTLVGVILADQSLAFPDFRAAERTFQLLTQVGGRAGRGERAGRVVLQTYQPDHPAVRFATRHDYLGFCESEMGAREELSYPPFAHMVAVRVDAGSEERAREAADALVRFARAHPAARDGGVIVLGPATAPIARLRGRYRFRALLKAPERPHLRAVVTALAARIDEGMGSARAILDVDPVAML
ncbi:MAG: primosomal protein N' [Myxococcales bacterium]|nr:primosomal protein N' [Myxococcales bacterium]